MYNIVLAMATELRFSHTSIDFAVRLVEEVQKAVNDKHGQMLGVPWITG